jgi:hypothetical protein
MSYHRKYRRICSTIRKWGDNDGGQNNDTDAFASHAVGDISGPLNIESDVFEERVLSQTEVEAFRYCYDSDTPPLPARLTMIHQTRMLVTLFTTSLTSRE